MDTSPTSFLSEIVEGIHGREIPKHKLAYFRARLRNRIYDLVITEFVRLQEQEGATKADLARRIGRDAALISRWLSAPSNWTLDTISDLLVAMKSEPELGIQAVGEQVTTEQAAKRKQKAIVQMSDLFHWHAQPTPDPYLDLARQSPIILTKLLKNPRQEAARQ